MEKISDLIVFNTNQFVALNKPAGMPSHPDKTGDRSAFDLAEIYSKKKLFPLHRIDRPASGLIIFAKTLNMAQHFNELLKSNAISKEYLAVVPNGTLKAEDTLEDYILKVPAYSKSKISAKDDSNAKHAELTYQTIDQIDNYKLLHVQLKTGRHHQIRVQLGSRGFAVKGDVKYGAKRGNKDRSIHLHSLKMRFTHPVTKEEVNLKAPLPADSVWEAFDKNKVDHV